MEHRCGMCGRALKAKDVASGQTSYSRWTGQRYCPQREAVRCRAIYDRQKKKRRREVTA